MGEYEGEDRRRDQSRMYCDASEVGKGIRSKLSPDVNLPVEIIADDVLHSHNPVDTATYAVHLTKNNLNLEERLNKSEKERLEALTTSITDDLTGLMNSRGLEKEIERELKLVRRYGKGVGGSSGKLSYIMIDLDHFKAVNDTYSHDAGDMVLKKFAKIVSENQEIQVAARDGMGEEFVLLTRHYPELQKGLLTSGATIAEKIREQVANTVFEFEGKIIPVTISCGVTGYDFGGYEFHTLGGEVRTKTPDERINMKRRADAAMYASKEAGRNQVKTYAIEKSLLPESETVRTPAGPLKRFWDGIDVMKGKKTVR